MRRFTAAIILLAFVFISAAYADSVTGNINGLEYEIFTDGHGQFAGHSYLIVSGREPWGYARRYSEYRGGSLCCIESRDEQSFLEKFNSSGLTLWLGAVNRSGEWTWINSEEFAFEGWKRGYPSDDEAKKNAAIGPEGWTNLAYDEIYAVNGYLVEFEDEQTCLEALEMLDSGRFSEPPFAITASEENSPEVFEEDIEDIPAAENHVCDDEPFPILAAAAAAVITAAAAITALVLIIRRYA